MLRRLTLGLFTLACAAAIAACSSGNTTPSSNGGVTGQGPNFVTNTIYVSDTTQNAIDIYTPSPGPSATPQYLIGGSSTSMDGPSYLAFDSSKNLYVTNYGAVEKPGRHHDLQAVCDRQRHTVRKRPLGGGQPHGIAMIPSNGGFVVAFTQPGAFFSNGLNVYLPFSGGGGSVGRTYDRGQQHEFE